MLSAQLEICYIPGGSITVDEQLISTRGRCPFRQYMPGKPGKYGIKVFWCCDSNTAYPLKGEVYVGRQPGATCAGADRNRINNLVKRLVHPWINTGRTITKHNYSTSVPYTFNEVYRFAENFKRYLFVKNSFKQPKSRK
jgi:hypothetical protein